VSLFERNAEEKHQGATRDHSGSATDLVFICVMTVRPSLARYFAHKFRYNSCSPDVSPCVMCLVALMLVVNIPCGDNALRVVKPYQAQRGA
jgi:hypothetical protein